MQPWKKSSTPTNLRTIRPIRCFAWTNSRFSSTKRLANRFRQRNAILGASTTSTNVAVRPASSCSLNLFPVGGEATARPQRTKIDWALEMARLLDTRYKKAKKVVLVSDNLNTYEGRVLSDLSAGEGSGLRQTARIPTRPSTAVAQHRRERIEQHDPSAFPAVGFSRLRNGKAKSVTGPNTPTTINAASTGNSKDKDARDKTEVTLPPN